MLAGRGEGSGRERYNWCVTVKEELHLLIDGLTDEQASDLLEDLLGSADVDGPPLDEEAIASLDRGLADIASDRTISLENLELAHPLPNRVSGINFALQARLLDETANESQSS